MPGNIDSSLPQSISSTLPKSPQHTLNEKRHFSYGTFHDHMMGRSHDNLGSMLRQTETRPAREENYQVSSFYGSRMSRDSCQSDGLHKPSAWRESSTWRRDIEVDNTLNSGASNASTFNCAPLPCGRSNYRSNRNRTCDGATSNRRNTYNERSQFNRIDQSFYKHSGEQALYHTSPAWGSLPRDHNHTHYGSIQQNRLRLDLRHLPFKVYQRQCEYMDELSAHEVKRVMMTVEELRTKEEFRRSLEKMVQDYVDQKYTSEKFKINLLSFGSNASGFGMSGSDMDLTLRAHVRSSDITLELPQAVEKALLDQGIGARLIANTRIPILKVCQSPPRELLDNLIAECNRRSTNLHEEVHKMGDERHASNNLADGDDLISISRLNLNTKHLTIPLSVPWTREKSSSRLEFPSSGAGVLCDINFSNTLALRNTRLLKCYSLCDERVKAMVLFIKSWAKQRNINSSYRGTLSSYGYVLMVLHFLINVAKPPVLPNLQHPKHPEMLESYKRSKATVSSPSSSPSSTSSSSSMSRLSHIINGYDSYFFEDEEVITKLAKHGELTKNHESVGALLRNFFLYYAEKGPGVPRNGFVWLRQVISIRTPGGIITKEAKGWTEARTVISEGREIRQRYLLAIEDPFEHDHNVARTVTYPGIIAIRDEFRRIWSTISESGYRKLGRELNISSEKRESNENKVVGEDRLLAPIVNKMGELAIQSESNA